MCFGPPQQPKTPKAATFRTAIQVLMAVQAVILILNFVAGFITQGIFGILFAFLLFIIQRHLSHQAIIFFIFFSIFFAVNFMVAFLVPIQNQTNFNSLSSMDQYKYADAVLSFVYYVFCAIFFFYPYREFKSIQYSENPALRAYFEANTQQTQQNREKKDVKNEDANYDINYGNIVYDEKKRNNDNGTFQVFKGKGVKIG